MSVLDPQAALKRGYAIVRKGGHVLGSIKGLKGGDRLGIQLADGTINAEISGK
jgi:exonuclease VII large subunit